MHINSLPKPIGVVGLGITGQSVLRLLKSHGIASSDIRSFDQKDPTAEFQDPTEFINKGKPQSLVVSPGVSLNLPWIKNFIAQGGVLTSELSLAFAELSTEKVIAVTGSVGKSTVVALLAEGLRSFSKSYFVGGNFGYPLADYISDLRSNSRQKADWVVLELSSYQLENFENLKADISAITSLISNHMERYDSLDDYYNTKWTLTEKTKGHCFLNPNGGDLKKFTENKSLHKRLVWTEQDHFTEKLELDKARLIGAHNQDNLLLAAHIALEAQWPPDSIEAMKKFAGLPHRLEDCGTIQGRFFINDSKATTMDSVIQAVESVLSRVSGRLLLLLGGKDKNLPWQKLSTLNRGPIQFCFFGEVGSKAKTLSGLDGPVYDNLKSLMPDILTLTKPGDTILLSPGGTSLDEFKNFEERGDFFKSEILKY